MEEDIIATKIKCSRCEGTGVDKIKDPVNNPSGVCPVCSGTGFVIDEYTDYSEITDKLDDLSDKVDDCLDKLNDILEKLSE